MLHFCRILSYLIPVNREFSCPSTVHPPASRSWHWQSQLAVFQFAVVPVLFLIQNLILQGSAVALSLPADETRLQYFLWLPDLVNTFAHFRLVMWFVCCPLMVSVRLPSFCWGAGEERGGRQTACSLFLILSLPPLSLSHKHAHAHAHACTRIPYTGASLVHEEKCRHLLPHAWILKTWCWVRWAAHQRSPVLIPFIRNVQNR